MICNSFMKDARQHLDMRIQEALILSDIKSGIARFGFACRDWRFGVGIGHISVDANAVMPKITAWIKEQHRARHWRDPPPGGDNAGR